jgi:signal transduction histidine kinase
VKSFRRRLKGLSLSLLVLLAVVHGLIVKRSIGEFQILLINQALEEQALLVSMIEERYSTDVYLADLEQRNSRMSGSEAIRDIGGSMIIAGSFARYVELGKEPPDDFNYPPLVKEALMRSIDTGRNYLWYHDGISRILVINETITFDETSYGLSLFKDWDKVDRLIQGLTAAMAIALGTTLLLGFAAASLVIRSILGPLGQLTNNVRQLSSGNYSTRCVPLPFSELSPLVEQFNTMANTIEEKVTILRNLSDERLRFAENLIHEIGTPLTAIKGNALLLRDQSFSAEQVREVAASMVRSSQRLEDLQENLYNMMKVAGTPSPGETFPVQDLEDAVMNELSLLLDTSDISLDWESNGPIAYGQKDLIITAIINLVKNSIHASEPGTTVCVSLSYQDQRQIIQVRDQGPGIPEEHLQKVTEPFFRLDKNEPNGDLKEKRSLGLGLTLCKEIAEFHGGAMKIMNLQPRGLMVEITYPTAP